MALARRPDGALNSGFVIAAVFLAMGVGLTAWVTAYKDTVLTPLADEQLALMQAMDCEELVSYSATGYFWSAENGKWIRERTDACKAQ